MSRSDLTWLLLWLLWLAFVIALALFPAWRVIPAATIVLALAWQASRTMTARDRARVGAEAEKFLRLQRQFLEDASHQLRTPITIALGHAELLAAALAGQQQHDIDVVVGELERLKVLSERLLLVAVSQHPDFLSPTPVELDALAAEAFLRWQPTAQRRWQLGKLDPVTAMADAERLSLALDALLENSVRHTGPRDEITVSVIGDQGDRNARIVVRDSGAGIAATDLPRIFDRFASFGGPGARGTGLGLALVRAVAEGHRGEVTVTSTLGEGSQFELVLPARTLQDGAIEGDVVYGSMVQDSGYPIRYRSGVTATEDGCEAARPPQRTRAG